ncbi:assimilatory nitrate reductase electron transfer subunit [Actinopolyspora lacussalsi]|nr:assimilatory nitrate reductase electron transfer subunit [Actinopolyspora lacussalsi]
MNRIVIVGNGFAARRLARRLRDRGHKGGITVLGADPSRKRAMPGSAIDELAAAGVPWLPRLPDDVAARNSTVITEIDRSNRVVRGEDGETHPYDVLVLATGARTAIPDMAGIRDHEGGLCEGVRGVRGIESPPGVGEGPFVVLGGGPHGLETASALGRCGADTTLVHPGEHPLDRVLDERAGEALSEAVRGAGVTLLTGRRAKAVENGELLLDDGTRLPYSELLLCTGTVRETSLARAAGLETGLGIVVDEQLRTSDECIHAIGDCVEQHGEVPHGADAARHQADVLAELLTGGQTGYHRGEPVIRPRTAGIELLVIGSPNRSPDDDYEEVTLSDPARTRYARLVLRGDRIHSAVLLGFDSAIAAVRQLHHRGTELPTDKLVLLSGDTTEYAESDELPENAVICHCNNVTRADLSRAWADGARELGSLISATRATTGCGTCESSVRSFCAAMPAPNPETEKDAA